MIVQKRIKRPYFSLKIHHRKDDVADLAVIDEMFNKNVYELEGYKLEQEHPVVLDIGANIGTFTLLTLKVAQENNKAVTVYAIEPEKNNLELLKMNIQSNPLLFANGSRAIIIEKGLSDFNGTSQITNESGGSRLVDDKNSQTIEIITFDDLMKSYEIGKVDFTKIDIEGSETPLLDGASSETILASHFYAIEFDRFNNIEGFLKTMTPFMKDFSFKTWGIPANGCNVYFENHHWSQK